MNKSVAVLVGTRPELIKMAPVLRQLRKRKIPHIFIHSGQHYSKEMDQQIMDDLKMKKPDYNLHVGSGSHAVQTGEIMKGVEEIYLREKPKISIVHGDTNTTLAGALTAKKMNILVAHVEAGLRSFDNRMPEEINRVIVDRISDILFAPTKEARQNLLKEGINEKTIVVTGNTVVDALKEHLPFTKKSKIMNKLSLNSYEYILVTAHRPENVDNPKTLQQLVSVIEYVSKRENKISVWPIHPRTEKQIATFGIELPKLIKAISSVGYIDMLTLINNAALIMTDSGGIQEEAYILNKPLITLRDSTERPETLTANFIVHLDKNKIDQALDAYKNKQVSWNNAFGSGDASVKIVDYLVSLDK